MAGEKSRGHGATSVPTYYGFPTKSLHDTRALPDFDTDFLQPEDVDAFVQALAGPDPLQSPGPGMASPDDSMRSPLTGSIGGLGMFGSSSRRSLTSMSPLLSSSSLQAPGTPSSLFISAKNDWAPVYEKITRAEEGVKTGGGGGGEEGLGISTGSLDDASCNKGTTTSQPSSTWFSHLSSLSSLPPLPSFSSIPSLPSLWPFPDRKSKRSRQQKQKQRAAAAGKRTRAKASAAGWRTKDETREGYLYGLLKWPFLLCVFAWLIGLCITYLLTRLYIASYEQLITWRGQRERLRRRLRSASDYSSWVSAACDLDAFLGNDRWKEENDFAFYDYRTVRRVADQLRRSRAEAESDERNGSRSGGEGEEGQGKRRAVDNLKALVEACVKNNFAGVENRHLYSRTYYGTKNLVQSYLDEVERCLQFLTQTHQLDAVEKRGLFKRVHANYGRTALCLSGGASFAYYHFGVVKALLDEDVLPDVITGTSGGALVAALVATRTNDELRQLLVPALAGRLTACSEPFKVWFPRWWRTGARFDSVDWARRCAWWTRGSMTFREAYERTGRILNVSCVPADPHSPTILCNYRTAPDCVIWSAVLASAAVPGILNPVVLMMKVPVASGSSSPSSSSYRLVPYSFGHKWKDGSLRTDIPIKSLNLHFNVNFTIVSQVNPHVNLFFFSSRGSVGRPVTHRKGRGWRGGYLGSAFEAYLKQDLRKWLKLLRGLELLPRPLGQDWSQLWLQPFAGTVTIWPKSQVSDFLHILSDPDAVRMAKMLHEGRQSAFPPLKFISNRLRVERVVERGRASSSGHSHTVQSSIDSALASEEDDAMGLLSVSSSSSSDMDVDSDAAMGQLQVLPPFPDTEGDDSSEEGLLRRKV